MQASSLHPLQRRCSRSMHAYLAGKLIEGIYCQPPAQLRLWPSLPHSGSGLHLSGGVSTPRSALLDPGLQTYREGKLSTNRHKNDAAEPVRHMMSGHPGPYKSTLGL